MIASRPYTYASDVWSLGCVAYEMAARRPAFEAAGLPQLMVRVCWLVGVVDWWFGVWLVGYRAVGQLMHLLQLVVRRAEP